MDAETELILAQLRRTEQSLNTAVGEVKDRIAKLWSAHRELAVVVHGANKDNGLRSDVRALEEWRAKQSDWDNEMEDRLRHYIDVERGETCHGIAALEEHREEHAKAAKEEVEVTKSKIEAGSQTFVGWLTFGGVLLMAVVQIITAFAGK